MKTHIHLNKWTLCLWLMCVGSGLFGQSQASYSVIKVNGKVVSALLSRDIKPGDLIKPNDKLTFASKESTLHVINSDGIKTIRNVPDNSPREFMQLLQNYLNPARWNKSSRSASFSKLEHLKNELTNDTILVLGKGCIKLDTTEISLVKPAGVMASYVLNGKKVSQSISTRNGFNLGRSFLFNDTMDSRYPKVSIIHYENTSDPFFSEYTFLGYFSPLYVDEKELLNEIKIIITSLGSAATTAAKSKEEITKYLRAAYAQPIEENLGDWMSENKLLK